MSELASYLTILMIGAGIWLATFIYAKTLKRKDLSKSTFFNVLLDASIYSGRVRI